MYTDFENAIRDINYMCALDYMKLVNLYFRYILNKEP